MDSVHSRIQADRFFATIAETAVVRDEPWPGNKTFPSGGADRPTGRVIRQRLSARSTTVSEVSLISDVFVY